MTIAEHGWKCTGYACRDLAVTIIQVASGRLRPRCDNHLDGYPEASKELTDLYVVRRMAFMPRPKAQFLS